MELSRTIINIFDPGGTILTWGLVGTIVAIAVITTSLIQVTKELLPLRWGFQQFWIWRWFYVRGQKFLLKEAQEETRPAKKSDQRASFPRRISSRSGIVSFFEKVWSVTKNILSAIKYIVTLKFIWEVDDLSDEAWTALIALAAGGRKRALFRLPPAQLVAQIGAATQIVLEYPNRYKHFLKVLSQGAEVDDINDYLKESSDHELSSRSKAATVRERRRAASPSQDYLDARNRIAHRIQRNLDSIHIALAGDWRLLVQILAYGLSVALASGTVYATRNYADSIYTALIMMILVGIISGYLASVISDTFSVIHRLRRP